MVLIALIGFSLRFQTVNLPSNEPVEEYGVSYQESE